MDFLAAFQPFGVDFFCLGKKFLTFNLVSRNIKIKYRRSVLGAFWTLLSPIAMAMVYYFVFKLVLKVSVPHYLAFVICGVLSWNFFSQTALEGMESIVGNWGLLSKIPMPMQIFPYVNTVTNLVTLAIAVPVMIACSLISSVSLGRSLVLVPVYILLLFLMTYSVALLLSIGFVLFRDLRHLMGIVMQLLFYGTPVLYHESMVPERFRWVLYLNPLAGVFSGLHSIFVDGAWPNPVWLGMALGWTCVLLLSAILVQKHWTRGLIELI